jgi:hypothetical protein
MSFIIIPKNIIIGEDTIDVEYNDDHWCYKGKGEIVSLIKNDVKIVYRFDSVDNILLLDYDDGKEKFTIYLNKKICLDTDTSEKSTGTTETPSSTTETPSSTTETPSGTTLRSLDVLFEEIKEKVKEIKCKKAEEKKLIDYHKKIIDDHQNEINKLNKNMTDFYDQLDFLHVLNKYECEMPLTLSDKLKLFSKEIITAEYFIVNSTTPDIKELIKNYQVQLRKLITDKKFNINTKNIEGKTLLEISLRDYEKFGIFLLENDIDITPSVKNDIMNVGSSPMNEAYFDNAKRNTHLDLLVKYNSDIRGGRLQQLIYKYMHS